MIKFVLLHHEKDQVVEYVNLSAVERVFQTSKSSADGITIQYKSSLYVAYSETMDQFLRCATAEPAPPDAGSKSGNLKEAEDGKEASGGVRTTDHRPEDGNRYGSRNVRT